MMVIPKTLYDTYLSQGDRAVKEAISTINIRQLNNISDGVTASVSNNDNFGQTNIPPAGNNFGQILGVRTPQAPQVIQYPPHFSPSHYPTSYSVLPSGPIQGKPPYFPPNPPPSGSNPYQNPTVPKQPFQLPVTNPSQHGNTVNTTTGSQPFPGQLSPLFGGSGGSVHSNQKRDVSTSLNGNASTDSTLSIEGNSTMIAAQQERLSDIADRQQRLRDDIDDQRMRAEQRNKAAAGFSAPQQRLGDDGLPKLARDNAKLFNVPGIRRLGDIDEGERYFYNSPPPIPGSMEETIRRGLPREMSHEDAVRRFSTAKRRYLGPRAGPSATSTPQRANSPENSPDQSIIDLSTTLKNNQTANSSFETHNSSFGGRIATPQDPPSNIPSDPPPNVIPLPPPALPADIVPPAPPGNIIPLPPPVIPLPPPAPPVNVFPLPPPAPPVIPLPPPAPHVISLLPTDIPTQSQINAQGSSLDANETWRTEVNDSSLMDTYRRDDPSYSSFGPQYTTHDLYPDGRPEHPHLAPATSHQSNLPTFIPPPLPLPPPPPPSFSILPRQQQQNMSLVDMADATYFYKEKQRKQRNSVADSSRSKRSNLQGPPLNRISSIRLNFPNVQTSNTLPQNPDVIRPVIRDIGPNVQPNIVPQNSDVIQQVIRDIDQTPPVTPRRPTQEERERLPPGDPPSPTRMTEAHSARRQKSSRALQFEENRRKAEERKKMSVPAKKRSISDGLSVTQSSASTPKNRPLPTLQTRPRINIGNNFPSQKRDRSNRALELERRKKLREGARPATFLTPTIRFADGERLSEARRGRNREMGEDEKKVPKRDNHGKKAHKNDPRIKNRGIRVPRLTIPELEDVPMSSTQARRSPVAGTPMGSPKGQRTRRQTRERLDPNNSWEWTPPAHSDRYSNSPGWTVEDDDPSWDVRKRHNREAGHKRKVRIVKINIKRKK